MSTLHSYLVREHRRFGRSRLVRRWYGCWDNGDAEAQLAFTLGRRTLPWWYTP